MRGTFSETENLKQRAKESVESGEAQLRRWWVKKYELPPNHGLFTSQSMAALHQEMYEDIYARKAEVLEELKTSTGDTESQVKTLNEINRILGDDAKDYSSDPLIDKWEQELLEGKVPDLNER